MPSSRPTRIPMVLAVSVVTVLALIGLAMGSLAVARAEGPQNTKEIVVDARQFFYEPAVIRVTQGQRVRITLRTMDVTHGLHLDDYGVEVRAFPGHPEQVEFVADKVGLFRFRCTQTCGTLHPFMVGKLIVEPNLPFTGALALAGLLSLGSLGYLWIKREPAFPPLSGGAIALTTAETGNAERPSSEGAVRLDLLQAPVIGSFLRWRGFQFTLMLPFLFFLLLALVAGLRGTPVGSHNLAIVFVWVLWWPLLIVLFIPLGGRAWCAGCPVPAPGEWLQRLSFIRKREGRLLSLGKKWPARLRNMWLQNGAFVLVALFSTVVLTTPAATAAVLAAFFALALIMALLFQGRTFCRYVCPLGGFIGLCSMASPLAVRVKDREICRGHKQKECIKGSSAGYGCPWFEYPGTMDRNAYCGLCMECVKTCPKENVAVGFQAIGRDLVTKTGHLDEAYRTFIALGSAVLYSAVMLGPWGWLKLDAGNPFTPGFASYAALLLGISLIVVPGLFLGTAWLAQLASRHSSGPEKVGGHVAADDLASPPRSDRPWQDATNIDTKRATSVPVTLLWKRFSYALVPLALMAWIAFSLSLVLASGHYLIPVISDPLGHGWNLFGTAGITGQPTLMGLLPYLQIGTLMLGLLWSIGTGWRLARGIFVRRQEALRSMLPLTLFLFGVTATFLWLYLD